MLSFHDNIGARRVLSDTLLRRSPNSRAVVILRYRTTTCAGQNLFFVAVRCLHSAILRPPSRCDSGPCGRDKVQPVETPWIVIAQGSVAAAEPLFLVISPLAALQAGITPTWSEARTGFARVARITTRQASRLQRTMT